MKDYFADDPDRYHLDGDVKILWDLSDEGVLRSFACNADSDFDAGKSKATLVMTQNKTAMFSGVVSNELPKDGRTAEAGYAGIRSPYAMKSFARETYYDLSKYNKLLLKIRGDGRNYMALLGRKGDFDIAWYDMYSYPIFTRGGPYWQWLEIPFSKFYMSAKGRIQDKQDPVPREEISYFGIALADGVEGDFNLEIDYIAVLRDESWREEFAYEMYIGRKFEAQC